MIPDSDCRFLSELRQKIIRSGMNYSRILEMDLKDPRHFVNCWCDLGRIN